jgi:putative endonuclease
MSKGFMYILLCSDDSYYTGSTKNLELRLAQHQAGEGANHTKKRLPVELVYYEEFDRIDKAFYREKQVQGWSRKKKEALIENRPEDLPMLSKNYTQYRVKTEPENVVSASSTTSVSASSTTASSTTASSTTTSSTTDAGNMVQVTDAGNKV